MDYSQRPLLPPMVAGPQRAVMQDGYFDAARQHANHQYSRFKKHMTTGDHWVYSTLKIISAVISVACLVVALTLVGYMVFLDSIDNQNYVVNTFYTEEYSTDTYAWPVLPSSWSGLANQPPPAGLAYNVGPYGGQIFNHYYECLQTAQAGWGNCSTTTTTTAYQTCLNTYYPGSLSACNVYSSAYQSAWPAPGPYGKCIATAFGLNKTQYDAFGLCIRLDVWPMYVVPQDIDSPLFLGSYNWALFVVVAFAILSAFAMYTFWPLDFEEPYMIEYGKPKGGFNRMGAYWTFLPILLALFLSVIALFITFRIGGNWPVSMANDYPTTVSTNSVVCTFALGALLYFVLELFEFHDQTWFPERTRGNWWRGGPKVHPEQPRHPPGHPYHQLPEEARRMLGLMQGDPRKAYLAAFNPDPADPGKRIATMDAAVKTHLPALMTTWADGLVTDALLLTGFVGSTLQVDTDDIFNIFWGTLFYRLLFTAVARVVFEAYIKNDSERTGINNAKSGTGARMLASGRGGILGAYDEDEYAEYQRQAHANTFEERDHGNTYHETHVPYAKEAVFSAKVIALAFHIAALLSLSVVLNILFNPNRVYIEYPMLYTLVALCFIVPEALRFLGHLYLVSRPGVDHSKAIAFFVQGVWCWDLLLRLIFVLLLYVDIGGNTYGSRPFLTWHVGNLTNSIAFMQTYP